MSNEAYHGSKDSWSSSQLKDIITDEEVFIQKYVKKKAEKLEGEALDIGTYFHTGVLEPHKIKSEVAIFDGKVRYGKQWEEFKAKNPGKLIITESQKNLGDGMIAAVKASPVSMEYIIGEPEVSLFVEILVSGGNIYAPYYNKILTRGGWETTNKLPKNGFKMVVKVRADCKGDTFISDLKSTSGRATQKESIRGSISKYMYDLSASLYLDLFSLVDENITAFVWIFASKQNPVAASWVATQKQILVGRAKWMWAVKRIADLSAANWELADYLREAEPLQYELEWLNEKTTDLL